MEPAPFSHFVRQLAAGEAINVSAVGSAFRCTAGSAVFYVEPGQGSKVQMQAGLGWSGRIQYSQWRIVNGDTPQAVEFYIGDGDIFDNRLVGDIAISGGLKRAGNAGSGYGKVLVGVAAKQIRPVVANRSTLLVQNHGAADIYVGDDNAITIGTGPRIKAGGSAGFTCVSAIYGTSGTAGQDVRWFEETV